jgi:alkanesulfonate monooxygenase SsuD/methylene tetrahydromethanopterin reductase-like flavin-dependent oxidoreductase (luciferase family)
LKFAIFTHVPWPEGTDPVEIFARTSEQIVYAEELGFHSAWFAEHHFSRYSMGSSSLVLASSIAARTDKIRLGTGVLVPNLHNPIRLAEDAATLDVVSNGRLDLGFGRGSIGYEYGGFNVDQSESQERFQESIRIIQGLFTTQEFSYQGQFYTVNKLNLVPPPVQKPHPPIYIAASRTPATLDFLVSSGYTLCIAVVQDTAASLALCQRYLETAEKFGRDVSLADVPFFRYFYVAETEEQAREDTRDHINWILDIMQWRNDFQQGSEVPYSIDDWRRTRTEVAVSYDHVYENRAIIGSPDQCVAKILELKAQGIEYFGCNFDMGGISQEKVLRSMELFSKEVMPRII